MQINGADGLIVLIVLFGAWRGFRSGFVVAAYGLLSLVLELVFAGMLKAPVLALVAPYLPLPSEALEPVAFFLAFSLAGLVLGIVGATVIRLVRLVLHRLPIVAALDRVLGIFAGAAQYVVLAATLVALLSLFVSKESALGAQLRTSSLAPLVDLIGRLAVDRFTTR